MKKEHLLVFVSAFTAKLLFLFDFSDCPSFLVPLVDAKTYWYTAYNYVNGSPFTADLFWQAPFYPLFLYVVQFLTSSSMWAVKIIQAIIGSGTVTLVYLLGKEYFGRKTALIATVITMLYGPLYYFESEFIANVLESFVALLLLFLVARVQKDQSNRLTYLIVGFIAAISIYIRPTFIPFVFLLFIILFVSKGWQNGKKNSLLIIAGFLIAVIPMTILRYNVAHDIGISPYSGGINFYIGNHKESAKTINIRPGREWDEMQEEVYKLGHKSYGESSAYFMNRAQQYVVHNKLHFMKGLARKTVQYVAGIELPRNEDIYMMREWSVMLSSLTWKSGRFAFPFAFFFPLFMVGFIYGYNRSRLPLFLFILLYSASIVLIFNSSRYRTPLIPAASILAAHGLIVLMADKERRLIKFLIALAAIAITFTGPYPEEEINYQSEYYNLLGKSAVQSGRFSEGRILYAKASSLEPSYDDPHYNMGCLFLRAGLNDSAATHFVKATMANPSHKRSLINLYYLYQVMGDTAKSDSLLLFNSSILLSEPDVAEDWNKRK